MTDERNYENPSGGGSLATGDDWRWDEDRLRSLIGYKVIDRDDERIGTLATVWEDGRGEPAFLGVRTGWLGFGKIHVVPAHSAEWEATNERIRLPFSVQAVKEAPTFEENAELDPVAESRIYTYYQQHGFAMPRENAQPPTGGPGFAGADDGGMAGGTSTGSDAEMSTGSDAGLAGGSAGGSTAGGNAGAMGGTTMQETGDRVIPLREEELVVGKQTVESGGVRLRKIVRTEIVNQPVEVTREDVVIERVPASGAGEGAGGAIGEDEIFVPLRREEAVVGKRVHTREEVRVRKTATTESKPVQEKLRKEDVEVVRDDAGGQRASTTDPYRDDSGKGGRDLPM